MQDDHAQILARVATRIERAHFLRADAGDAATPVTLRSLMRIAYGALIALEYGNAQLATRLVADVLAEVAESGGCVGADRILTTRAD